MRVEIDVKIVTKRREEEEGKGRGEHGYYLRLKGLEKYIIERAKRRRNVR